MGYVQDLETLSKIGSRGVVEAHAKVFHLTNHSTEMLAEYMEVWDKLRMCCGVQMSKYRRNELLPQKKRDGKMKPHPICGTLDIGTVERQLMNMTLYKILHEHEYLHDMNKPSTRDNDLDGGYCVRYNRMVTNKGLTFNQRIGEQV